MGRLAVVVNRPVVDSMMAEMVVAEIEYVALDMDSREILVGQLMSVGPMAVEMARTLYSREALVGQLMSAGPKAIEMVMTLFDQMVIAGLLEVG